MQRGASHSGTGHIHRFQHRNRRHTTSTPHLHGDVEQLSIDLFRRVLIGDGPTRRPRSGAKGALQAKVIDLDDDAVKRMFDITAVLAVVIDHVENLMEGRDRTIVRRDRHAPLGIQIIGLRLVGYHVMGATRMIRSPSELP